MGQSAEYLESKAQSIRRELLVSLGALEEHVYLADEGDCLVWVSGPVATRFSVIKIAGYEAGEWLQISTSVSAVSEPTKARAVVQDLNTYTSMTRWCLVPNGESERVSEFPLRLWAVLMFGIGELNIDVPIAVIVLMVAEQIAKAAAIMTHNIDREWGLPTMALVSDDTLPEAEWSDIIEYFDRIVIPHGEQDAIQVFRALEVAFELENAEQIGSNGSAWLGFHENGQFSCEVPFGDGPFADSVAAIANIQGNPELGTSLIRGGILANPVLGQGVLVNMRIPSSGKNLPLETAEILNLQPMFLADLGGSEVEGSVAGFAHAFGAWVENSGELGYAFFVPSGWGQHIANDDLVKFFRAALQNAARLSVGSRRVVEPIDSSAHCRTFGFHAHSAAARGSAFGELG